MDSLLGFSESPGDAVDISCSYKLVPWLSWDEWDSVRESLFSSSPVSVHSALRRITAWRSRGCLPVVIEVTASIIEIQQKDPYFRVELVNDASDSEEVLSMLYCMAIMRLVNGVIEKTRKKKELSIAEAADAINIPRMLIDVRHEGSHRDLPSLQLVRLASIKAIDWLKSYYWDPQRNAIPVKSDRMASLRTEIKSRLCELAFCSKIKKAVGSSSSTAKGKRIKHLEQLCGRNKFLSLMAGKPRYSKSAVTKKEISKVLRHLVRLYSSNSSEVVSVLVELMLKGSDISDFIELPNSHLVCPSSANVQSVFDDWRPVIAKLSCKEPEFLPTIIGTVLEMIETSQSMNFGRGEHAASENVAETHPIEPLSNLFEWLVINLKGLKLVGGKYSETMTDHSSTGLILPTATLVELLRRCLLVSCPGNNQLKCTALVLARMVGNSTLIEKLNKLCSLYVSTLELDEEKSPGNCYDSIAEKEGSIERAAAMLEFVKLHQRKSDVLRMKDGSAGNNRWAVAKSWRSCPIGMLPCDFGSSGCLPILECGNGHEVVEPPETIERKTLNEGSLKRGSNCDVQTLNSDSHGKRMRVSESSYASDSEDNDKAPEGVYGQLVIGGLWKKVEHNELLAIASAVRILV